MYLDSLVTAIEKEDDMFVKKLICKYSNPSSHNPRVLERLRKPLYIGAAKISNILENNAKLSYYQKLIKNSEGKQTDISKQNNVLFTYVKVLEEEVKEKTHQLKHLNAMRDEIFHMFNQLI